MAIAYASSNATSVGVAGSTTISVTKPTGTTAGDLLIAFGVISTNTAMAAPSGDGGAAWTQNINANGVKAWWKVANGAEPASYAFTRSGGLDNAAEVQVARITGAHATAPIDTAAAQAIGSATSVVVPSVTVVNGTYLFQQVNILQNGTFTPPGTTTEDYDFSAPTSNCATAGGHETVTAGATGTRTWTSTASSGSRSGVAWSIIPGTQTITVPVIASTAAVSEPTLASQSSQALTVPLVTSTAQVYGPIVGDADTSTQTLVYALNRLAGTLVNGVPTRDAQGAANIWAGTTGLSLVGALNVHAGNTIPNRKELQGVLNQLAGTSGLGVNAAATAITA